MNVSYFSIKGSSSRLRPAISEGQVGAAADDTILLIFRLQESLVGTLWCDFLSK